MRRSHRPRFGRVVPTAAAATLAAAATGSALGITVRDDASPGGNAAYPATGTLFSTSSGSNNGVLISSRYVLTAAHITSGGVPSDYVFQVGGVTYGVDQIAVHPNFNAADILAGSDIAVVHLTAAVPTPAQNAATGVTPALLYTGTGELGQTTTILGRGLTGNGTTGGTTYPNAILSATNRYDVAGGNVRTSATTFETVPTSVLFYDFDNGTTAGLGTIAQTSSEGMISLNDSGGGSFITVGTTPYLAGIHSFVLSSDSQHLGKYGDDGADTRVSSYISFINGVSGVPEPASAAMAGVAAVGVLARRRGRR